MKSATADIRTAGKADDMATESPESSASDSSTESPEKVAPEKVEPEKVELDKGGEPKPTPESDSGSRPTQGFSRGLGTLTLSVKSLLTGLGALAVLIVGALLIWLVVDKSGQVSDLKAEAKNNAHAEKVALDYATGAANMSYEDTQGWLTRLTANTTPELSAKLRNAASQMEQLLRPMQWSSTSSPITAKVSSVDGDVYQVDAFVQIITKNVQTSATGIDTTATYKLTIDKGQDWMITAITSNGTNMDADGASPDPRNPAAGNQNQKTQNQQTPTQQTPSGQDQGTAGN